MTSMYMNHYSHFYLATKTQNEHTVRGYRIQFPNSLRFFAFDHRATSSLKLQNCNDGPSIFTRNKRSRVAVCIWLRLSVFVRFIALKQRSQSVVVIGRTRAWTSSLETVGNSWVHVSLVKNSSASCCIDWHVFQQCVVLEKWNKRYIIFIHTACSTFWALSQALVLIEQDI